jgi:hypothetical protein
MVALLAGNVEWSSGTLAGTFRIGASGAQLRKMEVHMEARFYGNSRTTINNKNNRIINKDEINMHWSDDIIDARCI